MRDPIDRAPPPIDFAAIFDASPNPYMLLDRELRYVAVNEAYLAVTSSRREDLIGRPVFERFPDDPHDQNSANARRLRASLEKVLATGERDVLPLIPYQIPVATTEGVVHEQHYWSATHTPIRDAHGQVAFVLQHTVNVTSLQRQRYEAGERDEATTQDEAGVLGRAEIVQEQNASLGAEIERLRRLVEQAPGFVCFLRGPDHVVEIANAAYFQLVGHRDILAKPLRVALPEIAGQGYLELLDRVFATGEPFVGRGLAVQLQRVPGGALDQVYVDFIYQPIVGPDGVSTGIFVQGHEVTVEKRLERERAALLEGERAARERAEAERRTLEQVIEQMPASVFIAEAPSGKLVMGNAEIERQLRYPFMAAANVAEYSAYKAFHADGRPYAPEEYPLARAIARGEVTRGEEVDMLRGDGTRAVIAYNAAPLRDADGQITGGVIIGIDLTEKKRAEREREALISALEASNRELDQFAYVASHDLKAPLRAIANLSAWIEDDLAERMTDEGRRQLALLRSRVRRLDALIDGILAYARAGRSSGPPELIDTGALLAELVELLAPPPPATVAVATDMPTVESERVPLQQVFLNVIGNALKHARRGDARVEVSARDAGAYWEFAVSDNGPGIAREYHARIWEIFQRLDARDKVEGTGIGLSIVKKLVTSRGGRPWVESTPGHGATFKFTWPKRVPTGENG